MKIIKSFILMQNTKKWVWIGGGKLYGSFFFQRKYLPFWPISDTALIIAHLSIATVTLASGNVRSKTSNVA